MGAAFLPSFLPETLPRFDQIGWFALLLLVAVGLGELARILRLPRLLGYVAAGFALGPRGSGLMNWATVYDLRILVDVALGLMLFELGYSFHLSWLRRNPWLLLTSVLEATLTFFAVFGALRLAGIATIYAVGAAAIGISTSPAVIVQLPRELRAQGQVTERLKMLTAMNCAYAVVATTIWVSWLHLEYKATPFVAILHPVYLIVGSLALALVAAGFARIAPRWLRSRRSSTLLLILGLVLLVISGARALQLSPMLTLLAFGLFSRHYVGWLRVLPSDFPVISALMAVILFALIGSSLNFTSIGTVALATGAFAAARLAAKWVATVATALPSGISLKKGSLLGLGLAPMSGLAVVLVQDVMGVYPDFPLVLSTIVLATVTVLELPGPILTKISLSRARETHPE